MICPNCSSVCDDDLRYCDTCGTDLSGCLTEPEGNIPVILVVEEIPPVKPVPAEQPAEPSAPKAPKGRLWPPLLVLAAMITIGTLLFFLLPGDAAPSGDPGSMSCFTIEHGVLSFHPEFYTGSSELVIPETVNGHTVIAIADYAFSGQDTITTVILPNTVTRIGDYAFSSCHGLRGIYIPASVTEIGVYAFADCDSMEAIYFPGSLQTLGHGSLDSCDHLRYILFDGTYAQWMMLYQGYFLTTVELHTIDGVYYTRP